jgi:V-type H+-transporting ATPase subunit G
MQASAGADGIQKLLAAEQAAQAVIQAARQEKINKIKQAQQEAEKEVQEYKVQREDGYRKMMEKGKGDAAGRLDQLEKETAEAIQQLESSCSSRKSKVTQSIIDWVCKVY